VNQPTVIDRINDALHRGHALRGLEERCAWRRSAPCVREVRLGVACGKTMAEHHNWESHSFDPGVWPLAALITDGQIAKGEKA
jgi:hypothetical protein